MWSNEQKGRVAVYRKAAGLGEFQYRALMTQLTGVASSTAPELTQTDFDHVMPALEALAEEAIGLGETERPRQIQDLHYWRNRAPAKGKATTRQLHGIREAWDKLAVRLPAEKRTLQYLLAMAAKAGAPAKTLSDLTVWQAGLLLNALYGRLTDGLVAEDRHG